MPQNRNRNDKTPAFTIEQWGFVSVSNKDLIKESRGQK